MKYVVILGDGMADRPIEALGNKTPLEYAATPNMDALSKKSEIGLVHTIPEGMSPGSDTANLSVLGYDPKIYYTGRSPLEALSIGVPMKDTDIALRCNIVTLSEEDKPFEELTIIDHSSSLKIETLSKIAYYHKVEKLEDLYLPTVDLCDYHHKVWHGFTGDTNYIDEDVSIDTFYRIVDILGQVDLSQVSEELYDDYRESYDEMIKAFVFELRERYSFSEDEVNEIENILLCSHDLSIEEISKLLDNNEIIDENRIELEDSFFEGDNYLE